MTNILGTAGVNQAITPLYDEVLVTVIKAQATLAPSSLAGNHHHYYDQHQRRHHHHHHQNRHHR